MGCQGRAGMGPGARNCDKQNRGPREHQALPLTSNINVSGGLLGQVAGVMSWGFLLAFPLHFPPHSRLAVAGV